MHQQGQSGGIVGRVKVSRAQRRRLFPVERFPAKLAYLWNEICVGPFLTGTTNTGARRAGPITPRMALSIRALYKAYQQTGGVWALHSLEDWANFFAYISTSQFLMGEMPPAAGQREPYRISFDSLFSRNGLLFEKILRGDFHASGRTSPRLRSWEGAMPPIDERDLLAYVTRKAV